MDHEFNEVQELLAQTARDFFSRAFPMDRIRDAHRSGDGFDAELWPAVQELGWSGAPFPESMGGSGGGLLDIALVIEEMGKGCAASPFVTRPWPPASRSLMPGPSSPDRWLRGRPP